MTTHKPKPLKRKLGLRGEVLLYIGILWLLYGWAVSQSPLPVGRPLALHELLPIEWRVAGWTITGIVAIFFAFKRWPGADRYGFGALLIMPAERTISWVVTPIADALGLLPNDMHGPPVILCISNAIVWGVVSILIFRIGASRQMLVVTQGGETIVAQGSVATIDGGEGEDDIAVAQGSTGEVSPDEQPESEK